MIDRVAVAADEQWRQDVVRLTDICKHAKVRMYKPAQKPTSMDRLKQT